MHWKRKNEQNNKCISSFRLQKNSSSHKFNQVFFFFFFKFFFASTFLRSYPFICSLGTQAVKLISGVKQTGTSHTHTHTRARARARTHAHKHARTHTAPSHTHARTRTRTHTHTHTHTQITTKTGPKRCCSTHLAVKTAHLLHVCCGL